MCSILPSLALCHRTCRLGFIEGLLLISSLTSSPGASRSYYGLGSHRHQIMIITLGLLESASQRMPSSLRQSSGALSTLSQSEYQIGFSLKVYRLIRFSLEGFFYFLKLILTFPGLRHGFGTFGGVQEPSDPILGLLKCFPTKFGLERTKDTFYNFNWIRTVFRSMRANSHGFDSISYGPKG